MTGALVTRCPCCDWFVRLEPETPYKDLKLYLRPCKPFVWHSTLYLDHVTQLYINLPASSCRPGPSMLVRCGEPPETPDPGHDNWTASGGISAAQQSHAVRVSTWLFFFEASGL